MATANNSLGPRIRNVGNVCILSNLEGFTHVELDSNTKDMIRSIGGEFDIRIGADGVSISVVKKGTNTSLCGLEDLRRVRGIRAQVTRLMKDLETTKTRNEIVSILAGFHRDGHISAKAVDNVLPGLVGTIQKIRTVLKFNTALDQNQMDDPHSIKLIMSNYIDQFLVILLTHLSEIVEQPQGTTTLEKKIFDGNIPSFITDVLTNASRVPQITEDLVRLLYPRAGYKGFSLTLKEINSKTMVNANAHILRGSMFYLPLLMDNECLKLLNLGENIKDPQGVLLPEYEANRIWIRPNFLDPKFLLEKFEVTAPTVSSQANFAARISVFNAAVYRMSVLLPSNPMGLKDLLRFMLGRKNSTTGLDWIDWDQVANGQSVRELLLAETENTNYLELMKTRLEEVSTLDTTLEIDDLIEAFGAELRLGPRKNDFLLRAKAILDEIVQDNNDARTTLIDKYDAAVTAAETHGRGSVFNETEEKNRPKKISPLFEETEMAKVDPKAQMKIYLPLFEAMQKAKQANPAGRSGPIRSVFRSTAQFRELKKYLEEIKLIELLEPLTDTFTSVKSALHEFGVELAIREVAELANSLGIDLPEIPEGDEIWV